MSSIRSPIRSLHISKIQNSTHSHSSVVSNDFSHRISCQIPSVYTLFTRHARNPQTHFLVFPSVPPRRSLRRCAPRTRLALTGPVTPGGRPGWVDIVGKSQNALYCNIMHYKPARSRPPCSGIYGICGLAMRPSGPCIRLLQLAKTP